MLEAKGVGGSIEYDGTYVILKHKGLLSVMTVGVVPGKKIPIRNILSVQFKAAGLLNGYIQFSTAAGESRGGMQAAVADENSMVFAKKNQKDFELIKESVEQAISTNSGNGQVQNISVADELKKLSELRDAGIISEDEFSQQKKKLL